MTPSQKDQSFLQDSAARAAAMLRAVGNEHRLLVLCLLIEHGEMTVRWNRSRFSATLRSRYGELLVAVRDQENRARFLGYDPALVKVVAYVVAAVFAAIGGALFVPIVGIISPADVGVVPSIGFLVGVAIGGRATAYICREGACSLPIQDADELARFLLAE